MLNPSFSSLTRPFWQGKWPSLPYLPCSFSSLLTAQIFMPKLSTSSHWPWFQEHLKKVSGIQNTKNSSSKVTLRSAFFCVVSQQLSQTTGVRVLRGIRGFASNSPGFRRDILKYNNEVMKSQGFWGTNISWRKTGLTFVSIRLDIVWYRAYYLF